MHTIFISTADEICDARGAGVNIKGMLQSTGPKDPTLAPITMGMRSSAARSAVMLLQAAGCLDLIEFMIAA